MLRRPRALAPLSLLALLPALVGALLALAPAPSAAAAGPSAGAAPAPGTYVALAPFRALDTRVAVGVPTRTPLPTGGVVPVDLAGRGGLPATGIGAVVATLTVTETRSDGYLVAWASDADVPQTSSLNWTTGQTVANTAVIPVGADGRLFLQNRSPGSTQVVLDVAGYYAAGKPTTAGAFTPAAPTRVLDTRKAVGVPKAGPLAPGSTTAVRLGGRGGPAAGAGAVVLNLTAVGGTSGGYVGLGGPTALPSGGSVLTWAGGRAVASLVVAPLAADGTVTLYVGSSGSVHLVADLVGTLTPGSRTVPGATGVSVPFRQLDTRVGSNPLAGGRTLDVPVDQGPLTYAPGDVSAVVVTLTVTNTRAAGYLTGYAAGTSRPTASVLNWLAGQTVSSTVVLPVDTNGRVTLYNGSTAPTDVVVDLSGTVLATAVTTAPGWTAQALTGSQVPAGTSVYPQGLSCVDSGVCAVSVGSSGSGGLAGLARRDDGQWSALTPFGSVGPVSCAGDGRCASVVTDLSSSTQVAAVSTPTTPWSLSSIPAAAGPLRASVACARRGTDCWVLGDVAPRGAPVTPYAARFDAGTWVATTVPVPAGVRDLVAEDTTCADDTHCAVGGTAVLEAGGLVPWSAAWDGTAWTTHLSTGLTGYGQLYGMAYRGTDLVTVFVDNGAGRSYADTLDGSGWSRTAVGPAAQLSLLSCSTGDCTTLDLTPGVTQPLLSVPSGVHTPLPAGADVAPGEGGYDLDCGASVGCALTGASSDQVVGSRTRVLEETGGAWTAGLLPLPSDAAEAPLTPSSRVSCWGTSGCVAVAAYPTTAGGQAVSLAVRPDGP